MPDWKNSRRGSRQAATRAYGRAGREALICQYAAWHQSRGKARFTASTLFRRESFDANVLAHAFGLKEGGSFYERT